MENEAQELSELRKRYAELQAAIVGALDAEGIVAEPTPEGLAEGIRLLAESLYEF